jgi:outer membrane protein assembly factor BamA
MLSLIKYFPAIILFSVSTLFAQTIRQIQVSGNETFDEDFYEEWSGISIGQQVFPGILDSVKSRVAKQLSSRGYYSSDFSGCKIEFLPDTQKVKIVLDVDEGEPTYIRSIKFEGTNSADSDAVITPFSFLEGEIFNKYDLEEKIFDALTYYENNGYPFAKIIISSIDFVSDTVEEKSFADIYLKIEKGKNKSTIDRIEITGNTSTKDYVILRELRIDSGAVYSHKEVREFPNRLNRLRFFEPVNTPQFYLDSENKGVLLIEVKEKQTNNFDGIIGYIPARDENDKGYLTGLVNVSLRNLFGTGRAAAIRWQQFNRFSQDLELKYLEPWLFGYPFNLNGGLFQRKQDTTYVQRKLDAGLEYLATEDISAAFVISTEEVIPTENLVPVFTVYNSSIFTYGINLKIDTRDDPYSPTGGLLFINSYSFSRKRINGPAQFLTPGLDTKINLQRISLSFSAFYEIFTRQVIALGINGRELKGSFFEESDLFRLGGTNTLRGYRENQFLGSRIFWLNLEYRFLLTQRSYAFVFFDTGYYLRQEDIERNIFKSEDFLVGYGAGLSIETGIGVLGVSYALAQGDSFSDGKIHFGIVNEF